jgi:Zn-dependent peptidase ImmA (M78 family)
VNTARAEAKATKLLEKLGIESSPVPVEEIPELLGAELVFRPFEGEVSGMVYRDEASKVVGVNSSHARNRQRFTIAHEIGHLVLHKGDGVFVDSFGGRINWRNGAWDPDEAEANAFAAELLMPRSLVDREVEGLLEDEAISAKRLVMTMAKRFRVSQQSMRFRLENLGILDPGALLD